jgi:hypothetical protein
MGQQDTNGYVYTKIAYERPKVLNIPVLKRVLKCVLEISCLAIRIVLVAIQEVLRKQK